MRKPKPFSIGVLPPPLSVEETAAKLGVTKAPCRWTFDVEHCAWDTECGQKHQFMDGTPGENHHSFCPYCGSRLRVMAAERKRHERWANRGY